MEVDTSARRDGSRAALRGPTKWLVACGELQSKDPAYWPGMRSSSGPVVVVDPVTMAEVPDSTIGEIWVTVSWQTGRRAAGRTQPDSARIVRTLANCIYTYVDLLI